MDAVDAITGTPVETLKTAIPAIIATETVQKTVAVVEQKSSKIIPAILLIISVAGIGYYVYRRYIKKV